MCLRSSAADGSASILTCNTGAGSKTHRAWHLEFPPFRADHPRLITCRPRSNTQFGHVLGAGTRHLTSFRFCAEEFVLCADHSACKYSCISWIAVAPSPTADATRLTERWRTSPAANTPGMLVSKKKGSRSSLHPLGEWPERSKSRPVKMYPLASISMVPRATEYGACPQRERTTRLRTISRAYRQRVPQ
jgi:hypothetical protein